MKKNRYNFFPTFILRTPLYPFCNYIEDTGEDNLLYQEAIYLSSFEFYNIFMSGKSGNKISQTKYKYFTRSCSRCTPFGLFAGCSVGQLSKNSNLNLPYNNIYRRVTRLDMDCIYEIIGKLSRNEEIKCRIKYYPNDSIYKVGKEYRYIEYYILKGKRSHQIVSVPYSIYLKKIIEKGKEGLLIDSYKEILCSLGICEIDAEMYVTELINMQILKSELELNLTGTFPLDRIIEILRRENIQNSLYKLVEFIQKTLLEIDLSEKNHIGLYANIASHLEQHEIFYNKNSLFQCDALMVGEYLEISQLFVDELYDVISFLNLISPIHVNPLLENFKKVFLDRYNEGQLVSVQLLLDPDLGITYEKNNSVNSEIIGNLILPNRNYTESHYNRIDAILLKKIIEAIQLKKDSTEISYADFGEMEENWDNLPPTISAVCEIISKEEILLKMVGGSSAANLLTRFAHLDKRIEELVKEVATIEDLFYKDSIVAEIIHLPEARTGNILFRPQLHNYEIHYLAHSSVNTEFQISVSDILVTVIDDEIVLYSKKFKKRIIPRLTNAHNFSYNSLPLYHFFCDLQTQKIRYYLGLDNSNIFNELNFIPQIKYKKFVLSKRKWKIEQKEFKHWERIKKRNGILDQEIAQWRYERKIPRHTTYSEGDNVLLVDWLSADAIDILIAKACEFPYVFVEEFLFNEKDSMVKLNNRGMCNELVFSLYKSDIE